MKHSTGRHIQQILPKVMREIGKKYHDRPDLILAAWPTVIGEKLAPMTQPLSFSEGILTVKVRNSTLHSLLVQSEKARLTKNLRDKFPTVAIKTIRFQLG